MTWSKGSGKGPWGNRPGGGSSGGGNNGGGGGGREPQRETPPDFDDFIRKMQDSFRQTFGNSPGGFGSALVVIIGLFLLWAASGIYRVDADEQGVVLRFGKYHRTTEPGLNYHLPYPVESVFTPKVTNINREEIGFRSSGDVFSRENRRLVPEEGLMLTGDKNIVSAQFEVQWRIKEADKYLFNLRDTQYMVKPIAETSMRDVMGRTELSLALSDKRQNIAEDTKQMMQQILDDYDTGIEIYEVNLLAVDAPEPVVDAFIDVLSAQQEKETLRNQAMRYRDGIIPVAQGQVEKMVKDAQAYKAAVVSKARGDAERFLSVYREYSQAKDVTKKRIYLETMEEIMSGMEKVILSGNSSKQVLPYLPLGEIKRAQKAESPASPNASVAPSMESRP